MNCFCKTCEDSQEVLIAVDRYVLGFWVYEQKECKFAIPCPDCAVPIDVSLIQAQPAAAE